MIALCTAWTNRSVNSGHRVSQAFRRITFGGNSSKRNITTLDRMVQPGDAVGTDMGVMQIGKKLGEGSYGAVFDAYWSTAGKTIAFKVEKPPEISNFGNSPIVPRDFSRITYELGVMLKFNGTYGFPLVYTANMNGMFKYYAMQKLGKSLSALRKEAGGRLTTRKVVRVAGEILDRLEVVHKKGFLMYDMHLGNFLLKDDVLFVIDLGMAFPYILNGRHINQGNSFIPASYKNHIFASRMDSKGMIVSRRDELERYLYLLVMLSKGSLPWSSHKETTKVIMHKLNSRIEDICRDEAEWLTPAFEYVYSMRFDETPNYEFFRKLFRSKLKQLREL